LDQKPTVSKKTPAKAAETVTRVEEEKKTIVEEVPVAPGKSLGVKKVVPAGEDSAEASPSASPASAPDELTVSGRVVSARPSSTGKLKLMVDTTKYGSVQVVVEPRIGMRVPTTGASVTVHGKKLSGDEASLVVRADSIDRAGSSSSKVVYRHGYVGRVAPVLPIGPPGRLGPPPMVFGPPGPPPYF
jgi:hypothetical protein